MKKPNGFRVKAGCGLTTLALTKRQAGPVSASYTTRWRWRGGRGATRPVGRPSPLWLSHFLTVHGVPEMEQSATHGSDPDPLRITADPALVRAIGGALTVFATLMARKGIESRSEEHTSELQSLMRISYAVFCLKKKTQCTPKT